MFRLAGLTFRGRFAAGPNVRCACVIVTSSSARLHSCTCTTEVTTWNWAAWRSSASPSLRGFTTESKAVDEKPDSRAATSSDALATQAAEPTRRGRGRPRKVTSGHFPSTPAILAAPSSSLSNAQPFTVAPSLRRGRPRKSESASLSPPTAAAIVEGLIVPSSDASSSSVSIGSRPSGRPRKSTVAAISPLNNADTALAITPDPEEPDDAMERKKQPQRRSTHLTAPAFSSSTVCASMPVSESPRGSSPDASAAPADPSTRSKAVDMVNDVASAAAMKPPHPTTRRGREAASDLEAQVVKAAKTEALLARFRTSSATAKPTPIPTNSTAPPTGRRNKKQKSREDTQLLPHVAATRVPQRTPVDVVRVRTNEGKSGLLARTASGEPILPDKSHRRAGKLNGPKAGNEQDEDDESFLGMHSVLPNSESMDVDAPLASSTLLSRSSPTRPPVRAALPGSSHFGIREVVHLLYTNHCRQMAVYDIYTASPMFDYMVVVQCSSYRQMGFMADLIAKHTRTSSRFVGDSRASIKVDGRDCNDWMAVDLGDIVVHFFNAEARRTYYDDIEGPYASHLVKLTRKNFERLSHHFGETFVPHSSSTTLEVGDNFPLRDYNLQPMESVVARPNPRSVRYVTVDGERKEVPDVQDDEPLQQPKHSK